MDPPSRATRPSAYLKAHNLCYGKNWEGRVQNFTPSKLCGRPDVCALLCKREVELSHCSHLLVFLSSMTQAATWSRHGGSTGLIFHLSGILPECLFMSQLCFYSSYPFVAQRSRRLFMSLLLGYPGGFRVPASSSKLAQLWLLLPFRE